MKNLRKVQLGLLAVLLAVGVVLGMSAFKSNGQPTKRALSYFKYTGTTFDETNYRNIANWEYVADPEEPTCGGTSDICVLSVDAVNLTAPGTMEEKLDDFFNNELDGSNQVNAYVTDEDNIVAKQN